VTLAPLACRGSYVHATTWGRYIARTGREQLCKRRSTELQILPPLLYECRWLAQWDAPSRLWESQLIALRETRTLRSPELSTKFTRHVPIDRPAGVCLNVARGDAVMHRAKRVAEPVDDYFLITKLVGPRTRPIRWTWQIRRRSMPLRVKYDGEEYATAQDARLAGETALKDLLQRLRT
jgi:hypothetical protein